MKKSHFFILAASLAAMVLTACHHGSGDQGGANSQASPASASQPAATPVVSATPHPSPASTPASAKQASLDNVPEMLRRPFTKEEMEKALQKMPPEVRARIQGMAVATATPSPQPSPKAKSKQ